MHAQFPQTDLAQKDKRQKKNYDEMLASSDVLYITHWWSKLGAVWHYVA